MAFRKRLVKLRQIPVSKPDLSFNSNPPALRGKQRVPGLDIFRSLAILLVLACHFSNCGLAEGAAWDRVRVCLALYGVQLFFILSGYLIGSLLLAEFAGGAVTFGAVKRFWSRRWFRTLPNYYVYLAVYILLERPWRHHAGALWQYPFFLQNMFRNDQSFFLVSWSLCVEEWFYLTFPLVLGAGWVVLKEWQPAAWLAVLIYILAPFLLRLPAAGGNDTSPDVYMVVVHRFDAIGFGVTLACVRFFKEPLWRMLCSSTIFAAGMVLTAVSIGAVFAASGANSTGTPGWQKGWLLALINVSTALLLPWFTQLQQLPRPALSIFTRISLISYSLYLCHMPVMMITDKILQIAGLSGAGVVRLALWVCGSYAVAELSYRMIEQPFLRWREILSPRADGRRLPGLQASPGSADAP